VKWQPAWNPVAVVTVVELSVDMSAAQVAVTRGPECGKLKNLPQ
jgi:hypothetical protein